MLPPIFYKFSLYLDLGFLGLMFLLAINDFTKFLRGEELTVNLFFIKTIDLKEFSFLVLLIDLGVMVFFFWRIKVNLRQVKASIKI